MSKKSRQREGSRSKRGDQDFQTRKGSQPKGARKGRQECPPESTQNSGTTGMNDISWYSRYPNLLVGAGSFPYPYKPGMSLTLGQNFNLDVPGVIAIKWMPSVGQSSSPTDPASIAAKEIYNRVRSSFSGDLAADAPDFMVYLLALDSIYAYIAFLKRIYRVLNAYTPENYILPDGLLHSFGITTAGIQDLRENRILLWSHINELVLSTRKFMCPALMDVFNRHYWMSDNVYADANSLNSQLYTFVPFGFYKYTELNTPDSVPAAGLSLVPISSIASESKLYEYGITLINSLAEWGDAYTISGYLMRAYEGAPSFTVDEIPEQAAFAPVYNEEVLTQIENLRSIPLCFTGQYDLNSFSITQDPKTNSVISKPVISVTETTASSASTGCGAFWTRFATASGAGLMPTLSIRSDNPTVADSVVASRLVCQVSDLTRTAGDGTYTYSGNIQCGTEIVWSLSFVDIPNGSPVQLDQFPAIDQTLTGAESIGRKIINTVTAIAVTEQFDWHPFIYLGWRLNLSTSPGTTSSQGVFGDVHNITTVTDGQLAQLHRVCLFSEFNAFNA